MVSELECAVVSYLNVGGSGSHQVVEEQVALLGVDRGDVCQLTVG